MDFIRPRIGIIGGAGPMAGALLLEKVIFASQKQGCRVDSDFPFCFLISYPFSAMLEEGFRENTLTAQLEECFTTLEKNNISLAAIACNTLHSFLPSIPKTIQLVHIIQETKNYLIEKQWNSPLILCSSTAAQKKLHAQYFSCKYADKPLQAVVDRLIDEITEGCCFKTASEELSFLCREKGPIVLGCTELTLLHERSPLQLEELCIPDSLVAEKIVELFFQNQITSIAQ